MSKRKVSVEDKIYAVNLYLDGKESQRRIADMFDVSFASVQQWIRNYESMGADAFTLKGNKKYSKELSPLLPPCTLRSRVTVELTMTR